METTPLTGSEIASRAAGTYQGQWSLVVKDSNGKLDDKGLQPGSITIAPGTTYTDKEGNNVDNGNAATATFRCDALFPEESDHCYVEKVNLTATGNGYAFFNKFKEKTSVGSAFVGGITNGAAMVNFTVTETKKQGRKVITTWKYFGFQGGN